MWGRDPPATETGRTCSVRSFDSVLVSLLGSWPPPGLGRDSNLEEAVGPWKRKASLASEPVGEPGGRDPTLGSRPPVREPLRVWFGLLSLRVFVYFDCGAGLWDDAIGCLAVVDVLATLAAFSRAGDQPSVCRPKILAPAGAADAARLRMVQVSNKPGAGRQQRASPRRSEANLLCVFFLPCGAGRAPVPLAADGRRRVHRQRRLPRLLGRRPAGRRLPQARHRSQHGRQVDAHAPGVSLSFLTDDCDISGPFGPV